jgi:hypothetical protein
MKTLHVRLNEQEFANRINANFAEVIPGGVLGMSTDSSPATNKEKVESVYNPVVPGWPMGAGKKMEWPGGQLFMSSANLSSMSSMAGVMKGVTSLFMYGHTGFSSGEYGHVNLLADGLQSQGLKAQGYIRDMTFYGNNSGVPANVIVNGYYYNGGGSPDGHTLMDVEFTGYSGCGYKTVGVSQACSFRLKTTNNLKGGMDFKDGGDFKMFAPGSGGNTLWAVKMEHVATPYMFAFDYWNPNTGFEGEYTVWCIDQARAALNTGVIAGRVLVDGRNDNGVTVRYDVAANVFDNVCFKVDENLPAMYTAANLKNGTSYVYNSQITLRDTDGTIFSKCMFAYNDVTPSQAMLDARPDYFIKIESTTGTQRRKGHVSFDQMSGLVHRRGRTVAEDPSDVPPLVCFKKHYCSDPDLVEWVGFMPGELKLVPTARLTNSREYLAPGTYTKAAYPMGYLFFTPTGTLDDANTTFTIPAGPVAAPSGYSWAGKVWP